MRDDQPRAAFDGGAKAGGSPAGEAGLDLSLGHLGTQGQGKAETTYLAHCLACDRTYSEADYQAMESRGGLDPRCPGCGRSAWDFVTGND